MSGLGARVEAEVKARKAAEVLGEITTKGPAITSWVDPDTNARIELESGPPPWEVQGTARAKGAREFIDCPEDWVLYWINPRLLEAEGWRGWTPVSPSDSRVKVIVKSMISPENQIRRGHQGDILAYMPKHWYESLKRKTWERTYDQTRASVDRLDQVKDEFRHGKYPGVTLESATHPTHTIAQGKQFGE